MIKMRILFAYLLISFGAAASAGESVTLLLMTGITSISDQGELIQLIARKEPMCRYFGKLMHKPQPQETTRDKAVGVLTGNVGEWWIDISDSACPSANNIRTEKVRLRVPLNPVGSYPPGTEVVARSID